ncbi:MAG: DUF2183 domain-containing protein [Sumerlaeia bacterium]
MATTTLDAAVPAPLLTRLGSRILRRETITRIQPYRGFCTADGAFLTGRVLAKEGPAVPSPDDSAWMNFKASYARWVTKDVPDALVEATFRGKRHLARTFEDGFFTFHLPTTPNLTRAPLWQTVPLRLPHTGVEATGKIFVPPASARFGVISDLDDTVIDTQLGNLLRAAKLTFFHNAHTRRAFHGVADFYRALQGGPTGRDGNPVFYVSSSSWSLYDMLDDFLAHNGIPSGPLLLKGSASDRTREAKRGHAHKLMKVRSVMEAYPDLPFLLIGDTGQRDPHLYLQAVREYGPARIHAVLLRDVTPHETGTARQTAADLCAAEARELGVPMARFADSAAALEIAGRLGLVR